jgi:hypothetical protein
MQKLILIILTNILLFLNIKAQEVKIMGSLKDTLTGLNISNGLVIATKFSDSTLVSFNRTDVNGKFNLLIKKSDTLLLIASANSYSDQYILFIPAKDKIEYNLGEIILPPQTIEIKEIVIKAYTDPVFFKGDTLVFLADSFKVRQNATVEDLLKKLPGVKVGNDGKVTVQGKNVDRVLVDGDEFFGKDPTIALKNLGADAVESVQVYDKKTEQTNESSGDSNEKILDLKLKDSAKKGYFGKVGAGSDANKFYEGEFLFNRFTGKNKVSLFYKGGNTPNTGFDWDDIQQYGLTNEYMFLNEDGDWSGNMNMGGEGLPTNHKAGFYLNETINKKAKINANYTYGFNSLYVQTKTNNQYFFNDSSFTKRNQDENKNTVQSHALNVEYNQKLDSLTEFTLNNQIRKTDGNYANSLTENFINEFKEQFRSSQTTDDKKDASLKYNIDSKLERKFKKKDRLFIVNYIFNREEYSASTLFNQNNLFNGELTTIKKSQNSKEDNNLNAHYGGIRFIEPLTKKLNYNVQVNGGFSNESKSRNVNDLDILGIYTPNLFFTNNFKTLRKTGTISNSFQYNTKKIGIRGGADIRKLILENVNLFNDSIINQNALNILPFASFRYELASNSSIYISYRMNAKLPNIRFIQPIPSSLNTNDLTIGNPSLKQSITNSANFNLWMYKPISDFYYGISSNITQKQNDFVLNTSYDSIGRAINRWENINGNYNYSLSGWFNKPFFKKTLTIGSNIELSHSISNNYINNIKNLTENNSYRFNSDIALTKDFIEAGINGGYSYNLSNSTLYNSVNIPFTSYNFGGNIKTYIGERIELVTEATYTVNNRRSDGYNLNLLIWNARASYNFLKDKNLNLSIIAYDLLNNNISLNRYTYGNVISDTKTTIIARYFTFNITYRFKNKGNHVKDEIFVE